MMTRLMFFIVLVLAAGCPMTPSDPQKACVQKCADWACNIHVQVKACEACLAACQASQESVK